MPNDPGVWIAAILGASAPVTAAIVAVAFRRNGKNCRLATDNKARLDVTDERLDNILGWVKKIDAKIDDLKK